MVVFSLKLLNNVRKAIAGRKYPHQLAGGVAFGVLLGIIPHGNLLALIVLATVLCFQVNHAMMGVVAIAASFSATRLDVYSHRIGETLLTHPTGLQIAERAWALPGVPWTDLNNTVVLGSFVIGVAATLPIFLITLPLFRWIAPAAEVNQQSAADQATSPLSDAGSGDVESGRIDAGHAVAASLSHPSTIPFADGSDSNASDSNASDSNAPDRDASDSEPVFVPIDTGGSGESDPLTTGDHAVSLETRIDVIRMTDFQADGTDPRSSDGEPGGAAEQPLDEALRYLLQQLRHSQQRKAAG